MLSGGSSKKFLRRVISTTKTGQWEVETAVTEHPVKCEEDFDLIEKNMKDFNALLRTWKEARDIVYNVINCSKPIVSTMSWTFAIIAPSANCHSNRNQR